jgi:sterol desaturase/sphingolipid hydroxylase (fatty acid hydroxylase superfamily)
MAPEIPLWLYTLIGLLLLDLIGAYLVHLVEHKTKFLWRFHLIHHTDTWIDTTTANRHHPGKRYPFYFYNSGRFNRGKSYVDGIPLPNAISNCNSI